MSRDRASFNAVGWDQVRDEDVRLGHLTSAISSAALALNSSVPVARGTVVEYKFDYILVKPHARTHYVIVMISENARYTSHVLRSISHGPRLAEIASVKNVCVHPRVPLADLPGAMAQFTSPPDFLPALVIEVWSSESLQLRNTVYADAPHNEAPETIVGHHKGTAYISGAVMDPEGISSMPPMRVRLLETIADREGIRIPVQNHLRRHERDIVESMHRAMDRIHAGSQDFPRERRTAVHRDEFFTCYTLMATNYSTPFTLEDFMSLYMFNLTQIKELYYDCTIVSSSGERPIARGALVVKLVSNLNDVAAPSFGNASERQTQYRASQPRLVFTLPSRVPPTAAGHGDVASSSSVAPPPPRSKRRVPDTSTPGVPAAIETAAKVTSAEEDESDGCDDEARAKRTRTDKKDALVVAVVPQPPPANQPHRAPLQRTRSIRNLFGLIKGSAQ